jgi:threonine/homoserine/homoserine lactone efflux protein
MLSDIRPRLARRVTRRRLHEAGRIRLVLWNAMPSPALLSIATFAAAAALLTVTPGVDTAIVVRSSASNGPKAGLAAGLGIAGGLLVWGTGAALGLTAVLAASALAFTALKLAGAAYLAWLGIGLLLRPRSTIADLRADAGAPRAPDLSMALKRGFLTNILNPKVGVFYLTFLPQFMPAGVNVAAFSLILAAIHVALTLIWFAVLVSLTVPLRRLLLRPRVARTLDRVTGCAFLLFGARLISARA